MRLWRRIKMKLFDKFARKSVNEPIKNGAHVVEDEASNRTEVSDYQKLSTTYYPLDKPETALDYDFASIAMEHIKSINADIYNGNSKDAYIIADANYKKALLAENKSHVDHQTDCRDKSIKAELNECKNNLTEIIDEKLPELQEKLERTKKRCEDAGCPFDTDNPIVKKMPIQYRTAIILLLTILFAFTDSLALYNILSIVFVQSAIMSLVICITLATLLDTLPLPLGDALLELVTAKDWKRRGEVIVKSVVLVGAFITILVLISNLRMANRDSYMDQSGVEGYVNYADSTEDIVSEEATAEEYNEVDYSKANALINMLNLEPILTSIVLLVFAFNRARTLYFNELAEELIDVNMQYEEQKEKKTELEGKIIVLEDPVDLRPFNEIQYNNKLLQIDAESDMKKIEFRDVLKEYLQDSADTNYLCEQQAEILA